MLFSVDESSGKVAHQCIIPKVRVLESVHLTLRVLFARILSPRDSKLPNGPRLSLKRLAERMVEMSLLPKVLEPWLML